MIPLELYLEGFTGIRSGLGKETLQLNLSTIPGSAKLVALAGPNGAGKTTIMDNLQPYRLMPSRSTTLGPGGFSYWDNICAPNAKKVLLWENATVKYRSTFVFKVAGKSKKAEYYLAQWCIETEGWVKATLPDGTISDGKSESYDRCVEAILGSPESFFTSNFSAQNRTPISSYTASDVKALLASILNLGHYQDMAKKAAAVLKLLRFKLDDMQAELAKLRVADEGITATSAKLNIVDNQIITDLASEAISIKKLDTARQTLSMLEAKNNAIAKDLEEAAFLQEKIERAVADAARFTSHIKQQSADDQTRLENDRRRVTNDLQQTTNATSRLDVEISRLTGILERQSAIESAVSELSSLKTQLVQIDREISGKQSALAELRPIQSELTRLSATRATLSARGKGKGDELNQLKATAKLTEDVPCSGHRFQETCPLLANATGAKHRIQGEEKVLFDMREQYKAVNLEVTEAEAKLTRLSQLELDISKLNQSRREISIKFDTHQELANLQPLLDDAKVRIPELRINQKTAKETAATLSTRLNQIAADVSNVLKIESSALADVDQRKEKEVKGLQERLERLAKPVTENELRDARNLVDTTIAEIEALRVKTQRGRDEKVSLAARIETFMTMKAEASQSKRLADLITDEIAKWSLIEKGLGSNGLIALAIDDAGPEISSLCNNLLSDCYGGRFAVRLDTQRTTSTGNLRETFDVKVYDNHRGEDKSLICMSGGERVWVNDCLTRAIALYVDMSRGTSGQTLFSDESDGPLDPDRKRQFMQMKRAVLRQGNYVREYFVSQTPELWEEADHIIDVSCL